MPRRPFAAQQLTPPRSGDELRVHLGEKRIHGAKATDSGETGEQYRRRCRSVNRMPDTTSCRVSAEILQRGGRLPPGRADVEGRMDDFPGFSAFSAGHLRSFLRRSVRDTQPHQIVSISIRRRFLSRPPLRQRHSRPAPGDGGSCPIASVSCRPRLGGLATPRCPSPRAAVASFPKT